MIDFNEVEVRNQDLTYLRIKKRTKNPLQGKPCINVTESSGRKYYFTSTNENGEEVDGDLPTREKKSTIHLVFYDEVKKNIAIFNLNLQRYVCMIKGCKDAELMLKKIRRKYVRGKLIRVSEERLGETKKVKCIRKEMRIMFS